MKCIEDLDLQLQPFPESLKNCVLNSSFSLPFMTKEDSPEKHSKL